MCKWFIEDFIFWFCIWVLLCLFCLLISSDMQALFLFWFLVLLFFSPFHSLCCMLGMLMFLIFKTLAFVCLWFNFMMRFWITFIFNCHPLCPWSLTKSLSRICWSKISYIQFLSWIPQEFISSLSLWRTKRDGVHKYFITQTLKLSFPFQVLKCEYAVRGEIVTLAQVLEHPTFIKHYPFASMKWRNLMSNVHWYMKYFPMIGFAEIAGGIKE